MTFTIFLPDGIMNLKPAWPIQVITVFSPAEVDNDRKMGDSNAAVINRLLMRDF